MKSPLFASAAVLLLVAACVTADLAGPEKVLQVSRAIDDFGFQVLHRVELQEKQERGQKNLPPRNVFVSPFSVSAVMAMLMAGAGNTANSNKTYLEIRETMGLLNAFQPSLTDAEIHDSYNTLIEGFRSLCTDKKNELHMANSMALQKTFKLLNEYKDVITKNYDAEIFSVDFNLNAHDATEKINRWVAKQTNGKIEKLFVEDLDSNTALVLLNAIYFKGTWRYKFDAAKTVLAPFRYSLPNVQAQVPTMTMKTHLRYAHFNDGDMVELPYDNEALSMFIYLPDPRWGKDYQTIAGQYERVTGHASMKMAERLAEMRNVSVNLHLPKFKIEAEYALKEHLQNLGIIEAFSSTNADLSRIDGQQDLFLSKVVHKAVIEVNEEGSVAAVATGGSVQWKSIPIVQEFNANRPFLFFIRDNLHQVTLFAGVINKP